MPGIYVGFNIGTNSVGYAVTDKQYSLKKKFGEDAWGSVHFDAAQTCKGRRDHRTGSRRIGRKKQRIALLQEIFAPEVAKVDERFFLRLKESFRWRDEVEEPHIFFNDSDYTDIQYMKEYPTIHHLITELMKNPEPHDVRLVYLACAWLLAHRGHFLNNLKVENIDKITDITSVYQEFLDYFTSHGYRRPWEDVSPDALDEVLKENMKVSDKKNALKDFLLDGHTPDKDVTENFPYSQEAIIRLLAGGECSPKEFFHDEAYEDLKKIKLGMSDEDHAELANVIGEEYDLILSMRKIYDWCILANILNGRSDITISEAKVLTYEQHKKDLKTLKYFFRKYLPDRYDEIFRKTGTDSYASYVGHADKELKAAIGKQATIASFSKHIKKMIEKVEVEVEECDQALFQDMFERLEVNTFLPKQRNTDNSVVPHQLYEYELIKILENASKYLPFLNETSDGLRNMDKIRAIFIFRIPYYVGPLNEHSDFAWLTRKAGKITPWNFDEMVDKDASESAFIRRMTNQCTYLPGEDVLPKDSLYYQKFVVLNTINCLRLNGEKISVRVKKLIFEELFGTKRSVTKAGIARFLKEKGFMQKGDILGGVDDKIPAALTTYIAFRPFMEQAILTENDIERIIERASYAEDKSRLVKWLQANYPGLSKENIRSISRIRISKFGRLSMRFLTGLKGKDRSGQEYNSILDAMWNVNDNLMEILSSRYTFMDAVQEYREEYYKGKALTLKERLDEEIVPNSIRRPAYRTLAIMKDIEKAFGIPDKIFLESTRGGFQNLKGTRTKSRKDQILDLYKNCKKHPNLPRLRSELESLGEDVDRILQSDRIFLYFMQFGRCAYSNKDITFEKLRKHDKVYDMDHIWAQCYIKDDSLSNKVLCCREINESKGEKYPVEPEIQKRMMTTWLEWKDLKAIDNEKFDRLTRTVPFSEDEKFGFINRQLVETAQSAKLIAELLSKRYPGTEIVYTKSTLVTEFRNEYELTKSRLFNDLHNAQDAYLSIVAGNVYHMKFSRQWFNPNQRYSIKTKTVYSNPVKCGNELVWDGIPMLEKVKKIARKNSAHLVKFPVFKTGDFFDLQIVKKKPGLFSHKEGLPTERYGGYNGMSIAYFVIVKFRTKSGEDIFFMPVELLYGKRYQNDEEFAEEYTKKRLNSRVRGTVLDYSYPFGKRPWKINTLLELDGFHACITASGSKGRTLSLSTMESFVASDKWKLYIKRLDKFVEKYEQSKKKTKKLRCNPKYDKLSVEENLGLYDLYINKLQNSIFSKRPNNQLDTLISGREKFIKLEIEEQCEVLVRIHTLFGRSTNSIDLTPIGGSKNAGSPGSFSSLVSNWEKTYSDIRIIEQSPSGIWCKKHVTLLKKGRKRFYEKDKKQQ